MANKITYLFLALTFILMMSIAHADVKKEDKSFEEGLAAAARHKQPSMDIFKNFKAKDTFKNYTESPDQAKYYGGVDQSSTSIKEDAASATVNSEVGKAVNNASENQKSIDREALANQIKRISQIQDHADDIVKGISDEFIDCTKKESCTTTYEEKQCEDTPDSIQQYCKKTLNVDLIPHQKDVHYTLNAHLSVDEHNYAGVNINVINGSISFLGPHDASFRLDGRLPQNIDCKSLQGKVISESGSSILDTFTLPACGNGLTLTIHISGGHRKDIKIDMVSSTITYEQRDRWDDGCLGLANTPSCTFQTEQCVIPQLTRVIQNIPVTRECWEKEVGYRCFLGNAGTGGGTCKPLRDQGCEQTNSICLDRTDGGCNKYQQTFRCPTKNCSVTGAICNGQTYCLDGDCIKTQKQADPDFQKAVAALSAVADAAKQLDQPFIFKGKDKDCDNVILGAANCCRNEGWLIDDLPLLHCSQEEKELGKAKENGTAHYVGQYSDDCVAGICLKKRKVYCVFPTKLARIVQEQGREKQLGRHFGSAKHPDCSGITTDELQKIDFSQIDFKEFYEDIAKKHSMEDANKVNQRIQDKMKNFINEGKSHDTPQH